jgi:hypothetical protein
MGFDIHYGKVKNKSKLAARENVFKITTSLPKSKLVK